MTEPLSMESGNLSKKLTDIVHANLSDENFNVRKLALEAGMSHATLHRRLKAIKNQDVSEFICEIRFTACNGASASKCRYCFRDRLYGRIQQSYLFQQMLS